MKRTAQLQGLRLMRFENVLDRWRGRELSQWEAAEVLGMSERTFRRWLFLPEQRTNTVSSQGRRMGLLIRGCHPSTS